MIPENAEVRESDIDAATALRRIERFLIGRMVDVDLAELGASGRATIQSIQPCSEVERDDGNGRRLVTAVFRHTTRDVYDLSLDDGTPSIGTTGNHPFWSVDRQQFVRADSLRHRECLQKANGSLCRVTSITKRDLTEPVTVYNLEIDGEHVYNVGAGGVLVHNICLDKNLRWHDDLGRFMKPPLIIGETMGRIERLAKILHMDWYIAPKLSTAATNKALLSRLQANADWATTMRDQGRFVFHAGLNLKRGDKRSIYYFMEQMIFKE